jgi:DNA polymerase-3 subunit alpha
LDFKRRVEDGEKRKENSLFADFDDFVNETLNIKNLAEWDDKTLLDNEYEVLGFYVSGHPLDHYQKDMQYLKLNYSSEIEELNNSEALFVGKIENIKTRLAKKSGNKFGIITLMDYHGEVEFMVFKDKLEIFENWPKDEPVAVKCYIEKVGDFTRISCKKVMNLTEAKGEEVQVNKSVKMEDYYYTVSIDENYEKALIDIYKRAKSKSGNKRLILILKTPFGFSLEFKTTILTDTLD